MDVAYSLRKNLLVLSLSALLFSTAFADSPANTTNGPWFVGASIDSSKASLQKNSTTVFNGSSHPSPYDVDVYTVNKPGSKVEWSLLAGYHWMRQTAFLPQYSVALRYQRIGTFDVEGDITQYSTATNYNYHINAGSDTLMLLGKADLYQFYSFSPYISLGLGMASDKLSDYSEQPHSGVDPRDNPGYNSTANRFAYSFGLGVDYMINPNFSASLGYEYENLGKLEAEGTSTWSDTTLSFGNLTSNIFLLSATYQLPRL